MEQRGWSDTALRWATGAWPIYRRAPHHCCWCCCCHALSVGVGAVVDTLTAAGGVVGPSHGPNYYMMEPHVPLVSLLQLD